MQGERNGFGVGNPPGRPNSNENSREKRDKGGECEHVDVDLGFVKPRHRRRSERKNRIETPDREQNTGDRADYCNQCALGQKLACDRPTAGSKSGPHCNLAGAGKCARELQIGNIRASDQQHACDRREQQVQISPIISDRRVEQRPHRHAAAGIRFGIFFLEINSDRVEIAVRLFHADSGFQPAESPKALMIITAQHARMVCDFAERQQHIWISAELKLSRKYADYLTFQSIN